MKILRSIVFVFLSLLYPASCLAQQETYRLRVENIALGRIEFSTDGGAHYRLIGRVARPATLPAVDRGAETAGIVLRSGGEGVAFTVAAGQILKLRPHPTPVIEKRRGKTFTLPTKPEISAIYTNLEGRKGIFGDLLMPPQTRVRLQTPDGQARPFSDVFATSEQNVFVFLVTLSTTGDKTPQQHLNALADAYAAGALTRARANKRPVVSGVFTLRAKLPPNEPDPIVYVTYQIDDDTVATQNTAPFSFAWDTRQVPDGEHLVEIRALNAQGAFLTHVRTLVVVDNSPAHN